MKKDRIKYTNIDDVPKMLTITEFASLIGLSESTTYELIKTNKIKVNLYFSREYISKENAFEFIENIRKKHKTNFRKQKTFGDKIREGLENAA